MRGKYETASPKLKAKCEELIRQVASLNEEMKQVDDIKDNMTKEIEKLQSGSTTVGSLSTPTLQFMGLYRSLQKSKSIVNAAVDLVILQSEMMAVSGDEVIHDG